MRNGRQTLPGFDVTVVGLVVGLEVGLLGVAEVVGVPVVAGADVLSEGLDVLEVAGGSGAVRERSEADSMGSV